MKVINLFGSPGTGKSTTAAGLFFLMKTAQYNVELITEYPKELVWQERHKTFHDQYYLSAKQNHRQEVLRGKVDYVITDSPLLLSLIYVPKDYYKQFKPIIREIFDSYENINIFLKRLKPYNPLGRNQNEEESNEVAIQIKEMLSVEQIPHIELEANNDAPKRIFEALNGGL